MNTAILHEVIGLCGMQDHDICVSHPLVITLCNMYICDTKHCGFRFGTIMYIDLSVMQLYITHIYICHQKFK